MLGCRSHRGALVQSTCPGTGNVACHTGTELKSQVWTLGYFMWLTGNQDHAGKWQGASARRGIQVQQHPVQGSPAESPPRPTAIRQVTRSFHSPTGGRPCPLSPLSTSTRKPITTKHLCSLPPVTPTNLITPTFTLCSAGPFALISAHSLAVSRSASVPEGLILSLLHLPWNCC